MPTTQREASRRDRLLRIQGAAEELLSTRSINDVMTKEVAERAGIGEATLFRYIGTKMELLFMVYGDRMDRLLSEIEQADALTARGTPHPSGSGRRYVDRIRAAYQRRCDFYRENPDNVALYMRAGFDQQNVSRGANVAQGDRSIRLTALILSEGQEDGALIRTVDPLLVAQN